MVAFATETQYKASMLSAECLNRHAALRHAFFTREGGVSEGRYASLNCGLGSGDDPERVRENRARALARLGLAADSLVTAYQVHSAHVAIVEGPWPANARPHLDGLVTRTSGLALGILTADCAPVLLADGRAGVIGAAHAGWRGAKSGILDATVTAMVETGARREHICAAVGPCIRQKSYEVGPEFVSAFAEDEPETADLFKPGSRPDRRQFDLPGYVARRLSAAGIASIETLPHCTYSEPDSFYSFRRSTHRKEPDYGRQLSAILLT